MKDRVRYRVAGRAGLATHEKKLGRCAGFGCGDRGPVAHDDLRRRLADAVDFLQTQRRIVELRERYDILRAKPNRQHCDVRLHPREPGHRGEPQYCRYRSSHVVFSPMPSRTVRFGISGHSSGLAAMPAWRILEASVTPLKHRFNNRPARRVAG